jgi:3-oxoacyl-[acyl-carrier-protein] synthase III
MFASIKALEFYLPPHCLSNEDLAAAFPEWSVEKIAAKTGISNRHYTLPDECSSDLGFEAALKLFEKNDINPEEIDYLLFCTQSPDYFLPTSACILQDRLGIPTHAGALDFNLGCSGFIYGLGLAKALIETSQANNVLLITAETYTKFIHPQDKSVRTIFGDAGAATLVSGIASEGPSLGPFIYGTDGSGHQNLIVPTGGLRNPHEKKDSLVQKDSSGNVRGKDNLFMDGQELFNFTIKTIPKTIEQLLKKAELDVDDIDFFVFHQANMFMLEYLRKKTKLPKDKFLYSLKDYGNTVSSTIPIALKNKTEDGTIPPSSKVMLVGFGVGYSWGATLLEWRG